MTTPIREEISVLLIIFPTMSEDRITEKVYCYDHPSAYNNHDALAIAAMNSRHDGYDPMSMAAIMGGGFGNQWNNPFIYLVWMMMAQRMGWGNGWENGNTAQNIEIQSQLDSIRSQMQDNQNSNLLMDAIKGNGVAISQLATTLNCDFNALQGAICDVRSGITKLSGEIGFSAERVINAVNLGDCNVIQALKDCCCTTQKAILEQGYENRIAMQQQTNTLERGQDFINRSLERGFAASDYATQKQTCDIINAGNANTQRIIDTLNNHWKDAQALEIQDLKFQLSQERQNRYLAGVIKNGECGCGYGGNGSTF